ncbi:MAG: alkaline phytoceramidase [Thiobacillus sp.]
MSLPHRARAFVLWLLVAMLAGVAMSLTPIPQPLSYHDLADQRLWLGLPNGLDTLSNALFVIAGTAGLCLLGCTRKREVFLDRREAWLYGLFFIGVVLIGFGSGYYHLAPDNDRLLWDRLPMMLAFMALLAAMIAERVGPGVGLRLLPLLLLVGIGSALYWGWSEAQGMGDLRPYLLMQAYPMLLMPLLLWLYPPRYSRGGILLAAIGLYPLALLLDFSDRAVFGYTSGFVSGHTLKHVVAALTVLGVVLYLHRRGRLNSG